MDEMQEIKKENLKIEKPTLEQIARMEKNLLSGMFSNILSELGGLFLGYWMYFKYSPILGQKSDAITVIFVLMGIYQILSLQKNQKQVCGSA